MPIRSSGCVATMNTETEACARRARATCAISDARGACCAADSRVFL
jgi:hypothetical protein